MMLAMTDELPVDPDLDDVDVAPELLEADGQAVYAMTDDGVADGALCISPRLLRDRRRDQPDPPA